MLLPDPGFYHVCRIAPLGTCTDFVVGAILRLERIFLHKVNTYPNVLLTHTRFGFELTVGKNRIGILSIVSIQLANLGTGM